MKISGIDTVIGKLRALQARMVDRVTLTMRVTNTQLFNTILANVSQPFQSVPSYIKDNPDKYPPGTIGWFSRRAGPLRGTPWEGKAQINTGKSSEGDHDLVENLTQQVYQYGGRIVGQVGYGANLDPEAREQILAVLFGTRVMQPRPFLQVALNTYGATFLSQLQDTIRTAWRAT